MAIESIKEKLPTLLAKYKYAALILVIGIGLMLLPTSHSNDDDSKPVAVTQTEKPSVGQQLEEILSHIQGAGTVKVLLTESKGERVIYQTDSSTSNSDGGSTQTLDTVTVTDPDRNQLGLIVQIEPPVYQGALVISQGADKASVKLAIVDAVSKVTGLGANQITVLKMK